MSFVKEKNILLIDQFRSFPMLFETYGRDSNEILELAYEVPEILLKVKLQKFINS